MKRLIAISTIALTLSGCGRIERWWAGVTGDGTNICVEGVVYIQFTSGVTVAYNRDGTIKTCG